MKLQPVVLLIPVMLAGCGSPAPAPSTSSSTPAPKASMEAAAAAAKESAATSAPSSAPAGAPKREPVPITDSTASLTPQNTKIEFVGTHAGPKPDPRRGGFEVFTGKISTDGESIAGISFEITADSLWTEAGTKLTNHLKNPDFFDTKEFPEIKFQSTTIETKDGAATVTGDLTLHGVTKSITVPVTATVTKEGVTLTADFTIDRTEFGINYETEKVEKMVSLTVIVGEKNDPKPGA